MGTAGQPFGAVVLVPDGAVVGGLEVVDELAVGVVEDGAVVVVVVVVVDGDDVDAVDDEARVDVEEVSGWKESSSGDAV